MKSSNWRSRMVPAALVAALAAGRALAAPTANGRIAYGVNTTTPQNRAYTASSNSFGAQAATQTGANPTFVVDRAAPTRDEHLAGYVTTGGVLYVLRWNGAAWSSEWNVTVGGGGVNGRRFDVAYESTTGRAMVVYSNNTTGANELRYRIWDGSTWTAAANLDVARITGTPNSIKLASRRTSGSNEIAAVIADTNGDLTAIVWSGSAWANENAAALSTTLYQNVAAGDRDVFDVAYESQSGDLLVVYSETAQQYHRTYSGGTWSAAQSWTTARTPGAMFAAANPDPASNEIVTGFTRDLSANVYARIWDGGAMGTTNTVGGNGQTAANNQRTIAGGWVKSGSTTAAVVVWGSTTNNQVAYAHWIGGTWTNLQSWTMSGTAPAARRWMDVATDPQSGGADTLMHTFSDANGDLWAKRLVFTAPSTFTWTNADGGAALTATLTNVTTQNFSFAYDRALPTVAIGNGASEPGNASIAQGQTAALDTFQLTPSTGTANVTGITVAFTAGGTAASTVAVNTASTCAGGSSLGSTAGPASDTGSVTVPVTIGLGAATTYYVCVTASTVGANTTVTGNVSSVTTSNGYLSNDQDTTNATLTVTPPPTVTIGSGADPASVTRAPGGPETPVDAFTLTASPANVNVATLTVTLAAGTRAGLSQLRVTSAANCTGTVYATVSSFPADAITISSWSNTLQATTAGTAATICVTPLSHAAMPAPPGADYGVTANVTGVTATGYAQAGSDSASATVTIDNSSPADATITSTTTPGTGQIKVDWTNPAADFGNYVVVLRNTTSITDRPSEGTASYTAGGTIGTSTIACVGNIATCTATGLASGTRYYLEVFPRDANDNWAVGAETSAVTTDARTTPVSLAGSAPTCAQANLSASYTGDTPTSNNTVTFARSASAAGPFTNLAACTGLGGGTNPRTCSDATVAPAATYYYRATFSDSDGIVGGASVDSGAVAVPVCGATLAVTPGAMPAAANVTAGSSGSVVGRIVLTASGGTVTVRSIAVSNTGTAVAVSDVSSLTLYDDGSGAFLGQGAWNASTSKYDFGGLALDVAAGSPVTLRVVLSVDMGATAARTFAMRVAVPADVAVVVPSTVSNTATISGNTFTVVAGGVAGSTNANAPMASIVNPAKGAVVSPDPVNGQYKVQIRVFNPAGQSGIAGITANSVQLSADDGATWPLTATRNTRYDTGTPTVTGTVYEVLVTGPAPGSYTLRARASNAVVTNVRSEPVQISVTAPNRGDGNLLVRDNSSQLCTDCHALQTHSSEAVGTRYGSWATTCRDCHEPHGTRNIMLVKETITPPSVNGVQTAKNVGFVRRTGDSSSAGWDGANNKPTGIASFVNMDNKGPCQVCHTRTQSPGAVARWRTTGNADTHYTAASGTAPCTNCHSHAAGFGGGESAGGAACGGCHSGIKDMMAGADGSGTGSQPSKHSLVGFTDSASDTALSWSTLTTLGDAAAAPANRSCVNMCHSDHPHDLTTPTLATHDNNLYLDPSTQASRGNGSANRTSGFRAKTDFDPTGNAGMCTKCHSKPIAAGRPTITDAAYGASAHDFTSTATPAVTWEYVMHDGGKTQRNCTKCHTSRTEGNTPSVSGLGVAAVHGTSDPSLLAGTRRPAGTAAGYVCYNCHGSAASPGAGAQGNRSNKDIQTQIAKARNHPANADTVHDTTTERNTAAFGNTLGVTGRHSSCMDCHDPHQAKAGTHAVTTNVAGPPLEGAWGAQLSSNPAFWTAPAAGNFTKKVIVAGTDVEATLCFKCHSSYYGTLPNSPSGGYAETDTAREFNPNNAGNWYTTGTTTTWSNGETAGGFHPVLANAGNNLGAINMANLVTTNFAWRTSGARNLMTCTDCHESDAAADPNGPHGSTAGFILRGPNTTWNGTMVATSTGMPAGAFCANCHSSTYASSRFATDNHTSRSAHRVNCWNCHARVPHGGPRPGILIAPAGANANVGGTIAGWDTTAPYWGLGTSTGKLYLVSYPSGQATQWGQSNCGCNGTGH